jgi:hypothetical protein
VCETVHAVQVTFPDMDSATASADHAWASVALSADGELLLGATKLSQYLTVAAAALAEPLGVSLLHAAQATAPQAADLGLSAPPSALGACPGDNALQEALRARERAYPGVCWWAARVAVAQQRSLSGTSLSLLRAVLHLHAAADAFPLPPEATDTAQRLHAARAIEAALAWQLFAQPDESSRRLASAGSALRLKLSTCGALGVRTSAQTEAKAQLVLRICREESGGLAGGSGQAVEDVRPSLPDGDESWAGWTDGSGVHVAPKLEAGAGVSRFAPLSPPLLHHSLFLHCPVKVRRPLSWREVAATHRRTKAKQRTQACMHAYRDGHDTERTRSGVRPRSGARPPQGRGEGRPPRVGPGTVCRCRPPAAAQLLYVPGGGNAAARAARSQAATRA